MALTTEQQQQVDIANAIETHRNTEMGTFETQRNKMQAVQLAQQMLIENRRYQSADSVTDITSSEVTTLAQSLVDFVTS